MLKLSSLYGKRVFLEKKARLHSYGKIRTAVFAPSGRELVGFIVKRPDAAAMFKRDDAFLAWDSLRVSSAFTEQGDIIVPEINADQLLNDGAHERLKLDWDRCIIWSGMNARLLSGREIGRVTDCVYNEKTAQVDYFIINDGELAQAIVGGLKIPAARLAGYKDGFMLVNAQVEELTLTGGVVETAGKAYAAAKERASELGQKAGQQIAQAADKGSRQLGRSLGSMSKGVGGMFSAFKEEYKKASRGE